MQIKRFYCENELASGVELQLVGDRAHYIRNVIRIKAGEQIRCFNEKDGEFDAQIVDVTKKSVDLHIDKKVASVKEPVLNIHLGQVISRGERMDFVVQKATELGVSTITPLFSERCNVKLNDERAKNRVQHWSHIAVSACEQSGRIHVPKICSPIDLNNWLNSRNEDTLFICDPDIESEYQQLSTPKSAAVLIGPEGGFSPNEVDLVRKKSFKNINLGPRILRTETATVVALTVLQLKWGDI